MTRFRLLSFAAVTATLSLACGVGGSKNPTDTSGPLVVIDAPAAGATVDRNVSIDVRAVDDVGVDKVRISIDGVLLVDLFTAPYHASWNSNGVPTNTNHTITAEATDLSGNKFSQSVGVHVVHEVQ